MPEEVIMNQLDEHALDVHVKVVGWLFIITNAFLLTIGVMGLFFMFGIGVIAQDLTAFQVLGVLGTAGLIFFSILGLPGIIAGVGLLRRTVWGRVLALVLGILGLTAFPIGTFIGLYTVFVLLQNSASAYFGGPSIQSKPMAA
jgi:hypothetical protein